MRVVCGVVYILYLLGEEEVDGWAIFGDVFVVLGFLALEGIGF